MDEEDRGFARRQWDENYGGETGAYLDPVIPAKDLLRLLDGSKPVKTHVDKHIAHSEDPGLTPEDPGSTSPEASSRSTTSMMRST
jgi:hypothetical protein